MSKSKLVIVNKKRFIIVIGIFILLVGIFIVLVNNKKFDPSDSKYSKNVEKYSNNLKSEYSKDGMMDKFILTYNKIQDSAAQLVFSRVTEDETSFDTLVKEINKYLKDKDYEKLNLTKEEGNFWVGTFQMDSTGKLKFEFESDTIIPSWSKNEEVKGMIK